MPLPCGSAIPHTGVRAHSICSVTPSAHLHITVPTSAYLLAFPRSLGFLGNPSPASSMRLTNPPGGEAQGYSVPGRCLALRAGPHCSPGDVVGCSLEHAVSCPAGEDGLLSCLHVPFGPSLLIPRWLVIPNDDSGVSSSAYPYATLLWRDSRVDSA